MSGEMTPEKVKEKINGRGGVSSLSRDETRFALEYDLLSEAQIVDELGLDTPKKVQAVLAGDEVYDPASVQASGNHLNLSPDEVVLIERRRAKAEAAAEADTGSRIKVSSAIREKDGSPYDEGWSNEDRRAALAERGLSVDGRKDDLIARLVRSDNDALEEGDQAQAQ